VFDINDDGFGTFTTLTCSDVLGTPVVQVTGRGLAVTPWGEVKASVRKSVDELKKLRPRFDPARTIDLAARLSAVETFPLNEQQLERMSSEGLLHSSIEGLWSATNDSGYRFGIVSSRPQGDFVAVIFESTESYFWAPGMVKARFAQTADDHTYAATWRMGDRTEVRGVATVNGSTLTISVSRAGKTDTFQYLKLRSGATASDVPQTATTGTGFFCAPGIVATNAHVIAQARSVQMYLPSQKRTLNLELIASDTANDVAVLRVVGNELNVPPTLPLESDVKLGGEAVVVGFPLDDVLGQGHKVTTGVVSGLDGLNGDPRKMQLTAPIQPGSSGSPVFDRSGRVIGIVTSTLNTASAIRASGQVPQNVNFALKSDYLALLLRRVPGANPRQQPAGTTVPSVPALIEQVSPSVGQIRTYR